MSEDRTWQKPYEVDATNARRHVGILVRRGMPKAAIARRAKTSKTTVNELMSRKRKYIGADLEKRLVAVKFDATSGPKGRYAAEDQFMLKALNWRGYDNVTIAAGVGMNENTVRRIIAGQAAITYSMHARIRRYYARHWAFYGGNDRAHLRAERRGFDPPDEWDGTPVPHGTMKGYMRGCHCAECRLANAEYKAAYENRRILGYDRGKMSGVPAQVHVQVLLAKDMPLGAIAVKAGVSRQYLQRLVYGVNGNVTQRIPRDIDRRIRDVRYDPALLKTGRRSADGTERRLRGLVWMRWPLEDIAAGTGIKEGPLRWLIKGRAGHVSERVYEAVKRFYDANWNRDGGSEEARDWAIRERFAPPSAWSEHTIDDPKAKPQGVDPQIYEEAAS